MVASEAKSKFSAAEKSSSSQNPLHHVPMERATRVVRIVIEIPRRKRFGNERSGVHPEGRQQGVRELPAARLTATTNFRERRFQKKSRTLALRESAASARANRRGVLARDAHHGDCPGLDPTKPTHNLGLQDAPDHSGEA